MTRRGCARRTLRLVFVQAVVVAILLEVALRLVAPHTALRRLLYQPTAAASYRNAQTVEQLLDLSMLGFVPHTESFGYVLNSQSLRTKEYTETKPPGVFRVLAFGDSFTWASGALPHEQHWTTILEQRLRSTIGPGVEVLRLGVPATGPAFQYRLWQIEGSRLDPDLVIQAFFVGNDFVDHQGIKETRGLRDRGRLEILADDWLTFRLARNLARVARSVVRHGATAVGGGAAFDHGGFPIPEYSDHFDPDRPSLARDEFVEIEARSMALCLDQNEAQYEVLLGRVGATLAAFHSEVEERGARFVVMIIPDEYRVEPELAAEVAATEGRPLDAYDLDRPARRLCEYLSARGIDHLDLTPEFVRRGAETKLYRSRDTHWNHEGNLVAAGLLAVYLTAAGESDHRPPDSALVSSNNWEDGTPDRFNR